MRMHRAVITLLACGALGALGPPAAADEPASRQQIQAWVRDLGAERYSRRTAATENLLAAGKAAIEPLVHGLGEQGLEVTTRGIAVLQQLAVAGDQETEEAARLSLEKIAAARVTAAARHARDALNKLDTLRQQRAVEELARLGAIFNREHQELGLPLASAFAVEINSDWQGQAEDLRWLKFLRDVEQITLIGPRVDDSWLAQVRQMPNVVVCKIKRANITDDGLAPLQTLPRLQYLKLLYLPIGDDCVPDLARCRRVIRIDIFGSRMTREGEAQLREALAAKIDRRKGAFLGISPTSADDEEWEILTITENSSAEKAGLQPGDAFVTYDGKPVGDFRSLTALIAEHDVGDTVEVKVRRGERVIERRITLGEWN